MAAINVYEVPPGQKRAGKFTFTVDGRESLFYSSNSEGAWAKVKALLDGIPAGTVRLKAMRAGAKPMRTEAGAAEPSDYLQLPTAEQRIAAFMSRGKLATA